LQWRAASAGLASVRQPRRGRAIGGDLSADHDNVTGLIGQSPTQTKHHGAVDHRLFFDKADAKEGYLEPGHYYCTDIAAFVCSNHYSALIAKMIQLYNGG
jgi:hypothetical protein